MRNNFYFGTFFLKLIVMIIPCASCLSAHDVPWKLIASLLPEDPIVIESGAYNGVDTMKMSTLWPQGHIYSFEPLPQHLELAKKRLSGRTNVSFYPLALSDTIGVVDMFIAGGASSLLKPTDHINKTYFNSDLAHPAQVQSKTLDLWAEEEGVSAADFFWFDMEGMELRVLQAAETLLSTVKLIFIEVNFHEFWHGCAQYHQIKKFLEARGFKEVWTDLKPGWNGNVLYSR